MVTRKTVLFCSFVLFVFIYENQASKFQNNFDIHEQFGNTNVNIKKRSISQSSHSKDDKWSKASATPGHGEESGEESEGDWGYSQLNGPKKWPPTCQNGIRQSPIDMSAANVDFAFINLMIFENYDKSGKVIVKNLGQGVNVGGFERWDTVDRPYIYGGGLSGKYFLSQFHFHWSYNHDDGSEHTIGSLHYPVEVHFVHVREGYTAEEIMTKPDGIAVVGVFLTIGNDATAWSTLDSALKNVVKKGEQSTIFNYTTKVNLPSNVNNFYRYSGSLTTPGCNEVVIWTILAEPVSITEAQLALLRTIETNEKKTNDGNNRPTQPLNGRRILYRANFPTQLRNSICNDQLIADNNSTISISWNLIQIVALLLFHLNSKFFF